MDAPRKVERGRLCGAPLQNPTTPVVTCRYCDADNRIDLAGFSAEAGRRFGAYSGLHKQLGLRIAVAVG